MRILRAGLIYAFCVCTSVAAHAQQVTPGGGGGGGGGGTITSVNGQTGPVVTLTAPSVGAVAVGGLASTNTTIGTVGSTARTLASRASDEPHADDFSCPHDGVTDARTCLQNALNASVAGSIGNDVGQVLVLAPAVYLATSGNITVPRGVTLKCVGDNFGQPYNFAWSTLPCVIQFAPAYSLVFGASTTMENVSVMQAGLITPTSAGQNYALVASFAGTGITTTGKDVHLRHVGVYGFALGIASNYPRFYADGLFLDDTSCLHVDGSTDPSRLKDVECGPFLTENQTFSLPSYSVAGAADNGSGLIRLTLASAIDASIASGSRATIQGVGGMAAANYPYPVTVVDSTHIDLQGSQTAPVSVTGTTHLGSSVISGLSSMTGIVPGMHVATAGLPAATVLGIMPAGSAIVASSLATANGTGTATFSNVAYTSGGTVNFDTGYRAGDGFYFTNSENIEALNLFSLSHAVAFHAGVGLNGLFCQNCSYDGADKNDAINVGYNVTDNAATINFTDGYTSSVAFQLVANSSNTATGVTIHGTQLRNNIVAGGVGLQLLSGAVQISNTIMNGSGAAYVSDGMTTAHFTDDVWNLFTTNIYPEDPAASALISEVAVDTASGSTALKLPALAGLPCLGGDVSGVVGIGSCGAPLTYASVAAAGTYYADGVANSGAQSAATLLTACTNTVTAGAGGVRLFAEPAQACAEVVVNRSSGPVDVWPVVGSAIDGRATNAAAVIVSGGSASFLPRSTGATTWAAR